MSALDPMFPNLEEAEQLAADNKVFWHQERQKRSELYSIWQDYEQVLFLCDKCENVFMGHDSCIDEESRQIVALRCPKCNYKLVVLQTEVGQDELEELAAKGHKNAIEAVKSRIKNKKP